MGERGVREAWIELRKRQHKCWCDTCYAAHVRDRIGMAKK